MIQRAAGASAMARSSVWGPMSIFLPGRCESEDDDDGRRRPVCGAHDANAGQKLNALAAYDVREIAGRTSWWHGLA